MIDLHEKEVNGGIEFLVNKINNLNSLSKNDQKGFLQILSNLGVLSEISSLPTTVKLNIFKKVIYNINYIDAKSGVIIFEHLISTIRVKGEDLSAIIAEQISPIDEDKIIETLSNDAFQQIYNRSAATFQKYMIFSLLGKKTSDFIENRILNEINSYNEPGPHQYHIRTIQDMALNFSMLSPHVNIRNIILPLLRLDRDFVKTKFIPSVPGCEKYQTLL